MSFAAIISASRPSSDSDGGQRATLHFAGQTLVEYQARQASRAGAGVIFILVAAVTPALSQAIDRLSADGIQVSLIRDMVTLVRDAPRDRDMLLVADGAVVTQGYHDAMAQLSGNALLVADDSRASTPFERIDAGQRWAGLARVSPDLLFGTLDMIGDWDLELTLVRAAVQAGARRVTVAQEDLMEGRVALVEGQRQADLVAQATISGQPRVARGEAGLDHYLLVPAARMIAPTLLRTQVPAKQVRIASMGLAAVGLVPVELGWIGVGMLVMLVALLLHLASDRLDEMSLRSRPVGWTAFVTPGLALAGIGLAGANFGALTLVLLLGIIMLADRWGRTALIRPWMIVTPATAVAVMLVAGLLGSVQQGMTVATLAAIASIGLIMLRKAPA